MGLLDSMFGPKHPPLDPSSSAATTIAACSPLTSFAAGIRDRLEIVAGPSTIFVFMGRPPKEFGLVWFDQESRHDFRSDMEQGLLSRDEATRIVGGLTPLYLSHADAPRYSHEIGGTRVTVIDAPALHADLLALFENRGEA